MLKIIHAEVPQQQPVRLLSLTAAGQATFACLAGIDHKFGHHINIISINVTSKNVTSVNIIYVNIIYVNMIYAKAGMAKWPK